ncbi:MAG: ABC transporter permease [Oscillospiraceae bacterium]|nr:ABC transporter permease [Oscillospiraceae bacterium]
MDKKKIFRIVLAAVNIIIFAVVGLCILKIHKLAQESLSGSASRAWKEDSPTEYSDVTIFYHPLLGMDIPSAYSMHKKVEERLIKDSAIPKEKSDNRLWIDCASGEFSGTVCNGNVKTEAQICTTWGDYFVFHPEELISGYYYDKDNANFDVIVLDDIASWRLFGGLDTVGLEVTINGRTFHVTGVVRSPTDKISQRAYGKDPHVYIPADAVGLIESNASLNIYELCVPDKVRDYALTISKELAPEQSEIGNVIDQTNRFDLITLVKSHGLIPESAMVNAGFSYPWWENVTRAAELQARIISYPCALALLVPAITLIYLLFAAVKGIGRLFRFIWSKIDDIHQKKLKRRYEQLKAASEHQG